MCWQCYPDQCALVEVAEDAIAEGRWDDARRVLDPEGAQPVRWSLLDRVGARVSFQGLARDRVEHGTLVSLRPYVANDGLIYCTAKVVVDGTAHYSGARDYELGDRRIRGGEYIGPVESVRLVE